jgi:glycosyltransferase involved in cell wall biosynthesis
VTPPVSVVVPAFNARDTIGDLLHALANQAGMPHDTEIIVVDNGSTDGTREIVNAARVTLLVQESKRGPSPARNLGTEAARGEVIVYTDADCIPTRRWLSALTRPFADPAVAMTAGRTLSFQPRTGAQRYAAASSLKTAELAIRRAQFPFAASENVAIRRRHVLEVGGWAEDMPTTQDVDLCFRLQQRFGIDIRYVADAVTFHRDRETDEELRRQARGYGAGLARLYRRYPEHLNWGVRQRLALLRTLAARATAPWFLGAGRRLGAVPAERLEYVRYHRLWVFAYWRGFFAERRQPT